MDDNIPPQHLMNVFEVFGCALVDTVCELDHVQRREDITAENFMAVLARNVVNLEDDAKKLGVDVKFVSGLVSSLQDNVSSTQHNCQVERLKPRLVWSRPKEDCQ